MSLGEVPGAELGVEADRIRPHAALLPPVSHALGAEVLGVDLAQPLSNAEFDQIHAKFLEHPSATRRSPASSTRRGMALGQKLAADEGQSTVLHRARPAARIGAAERRHVEPYQADVTVGSGSQTR
jgi:hypothetical protein